MFKGLIFFIKFGWDSDKRYIIYNILYQLINATIPIVVVTLPKYIIEELMGQQRLDYLLLYTAILVGYTFIANAVSRWLMLSAFTLRCKAAGDFGVMMHRKLVNTDFVNLESPEFHDMQEKAKKFLYGDWHGFSYVFDRSLSIIGHFITLSGIIAIITTLNIWIVGLLLVIVAISSLFDGWAKKNELKLSLEQAKVERRWSYFGDVFENNMYAKEVRINNLGEWLLSQEASFAAKAVEYYRQRNGFYIKSGVVSIFLTFIQQGLTYAYLIYNVINEAISIGEFSMYAGTIGIFASIMKDMMSAFVEVKAYGIYYDAMHEYLNITENLRSGKRLALPDGEHTIEFKNVSFRYSGQKNYALKDINITLDPHGKLSVVGENGAGKTTFIKLLTRMYDPTEGEILLDGMNIKDIDYDSYMTLFAVVFQDYKLFAMAIRENVALASNADDETIEAILRKAGLSDKLNSLPNGINTSVYKEFDENGFEPSGGEGQKIAIARALYKDSPIIILDEPTASLDPKAEYEIYRQFNEFTDNKTTIYISHRMSSSKFCDKIIVFNKGEIVECGTHDELMKKQTAYHDLFNMQSEYYN